MNKSANKAEKLSANILSSRNYEKALRYKERTLSSSRSVKYICQNAQRAKESYELASQISQLANIELKETIQRRSDAIKVESEKKYLKDWDKIERKFLQAIKSLENGNIKKAQELNTIASNEFSDIELKSIKDNYLFSARSKIILAKKEKADRFAPITLSEAILFLSRAESDLENQRYENQLARKNAELSIERSEHAIFLTKLIQSVDEDKLSIEQLIIQSEKNLEKIASSADIYPLMTNGYEPLTQSLSLFIDTLKRDKLYLEQDQKDNLIQIADMEEEIRNLDKMLGGATEEKERLIQSIEAQARVKEQFERVERIFNANEARVFRENNNVILRLIGITFESNESKVMTKNIPLLTKVEKAIDVYPNSEIIIEGHTDSQGDDQLNQNLSQKRADSIKQYMINAMLIPNFRIIATGYGETKPIANNETSLGRQKNRRIDIVISMNDN
jgi:outer membrane protein OmpA-like peptidoglycan-associated protein